MNDVFHFQLCENKFNSSKSRSAMRNQNSEGKFSFNNDEEMVYFLNTLFIINITFNGVNVNLWTILSIFSRTKVNIVHQNWMILRTQKVITNCRSAKATNQKARTMKLLLQLSQRWKQISWKCLIDANSNHWRNWNPNWSTLIDIMN